MSQGDDPFGITGRDRLGVDRQSSDDFLPKVSTDPAFLDGIGQDLVGQKVKRQRWRRHRLDKAATP